MKTCFCFILCFFSLSLVAQTEQQNADTSKQKGSTLYIVELMPMFTGGEEKLYSWLNENLKYPQAAKENGVSGVVIVSFIVEKDGSLANPTILRSLGSGCDEEALRLIKAMPNWESGKQNGLPVRVQFNLPIRFTLE